MAVSRCVWRSRGWSSDGEAWCWEFLFRFEEFDVWYPDKRQRISIGCGSPDDTDCKVVDNEVVLGIEMTQWQPLVWIPKANGHRIYFKWTDDEQVKRKTLVERYPSQGTLGAWRVHRWHLRYFLFVLSDTEDHIDVSGLWYDEWPLDTLVESPTFWWWRETFLPMFVYEVGDNHEPDQGEESTEVLLPEEDVNDHALPGTPRQEAVLFCPLPGHVCHPMGWLTNYFVDHVDIFQMYSELGNDEHTQMQLKFQDSRNPSVFITTPNVCRTALNPTAANHAVITQKFRVLSEKWQAFARGVLLKQNQVPQTWLMNTGPGADDTSPSDLNQHSGVAKMRVLHGLMSRPNIKMTMLYAILESRKGHREQLTENGDTLQYDKPSS